MAPVGFVWPCRWLPLPSLCRDGCLRPERTRQGERPTGAQGDLSGRGARTHTYTRRAGSLLNTPTHRPVAAAGEGDSEKMGDPGTRPQPSGAVARRAERGLIWHPTVKQRINIEGGSGEEIRYFLFSAMTPKPLQLW